MCYLLLVGAPTGIPACEREAYPHWSFMAICADMVRNGLASVFDGNPRITDKKACGAAFFDVDGTLIDIYTSPLHFTYWITWHARGMPAFVLLTSIFPLFVLMLVIVDKFSRKTSNKLLLYLQFAALPVERARELCAKYMQAHLESRLLTSIAARLKLHAAKGDLVMLVSAGPLPFVQALAISLVSSVYLFRRPSAIIFALLICAPFLI